MRNINSVIIEGTVISKNDNLITVKVNEENIAVAYHHKNVQVEDFIRVVGSLTNHNNFLIVDADYIEVRNYTVTVENHNNFSS